MSAFISYSRANSDFALRLAKNLKSAGYNVWLDQIDIPTGARWDDEIEMALEACATFIVILSSESLKSQNVKDEVGYAIDAGKEILPVRIQSGDIPFRLRRFQYVDFTNKPYEASLKEMKSLLAPTGHLRTSQEVEKKPSEAEAGPITQKTQAVRPATSPQPTIPRAQTPRTTVPPVSKRPMSRGLVIGAVAVAALVIAGIVFSATRASKPPAITPSSGAPVVENSSTEQPTANPTAQATQVSTQAGQPGGFVTTFLDSQELQDNWEMVLKGTGKKDKVDISPSNEGLVFRLDDKDIRAYYMYTSASYEDVIIRMKAENLGQNSYTVGMVCRRTGDAWYEYSINAASLWQLSDFHGEYERVDNAGTTFGKSGKSINEYEMRCIGDEISLYVNGQLVNAYKIIPPRDLYPKGQAGFVVSTERGVFPIDVRVIEFEVSTTSSGSADAGNAPTAAGGNADTASSGAASGDGEIFVSPKDGMTMVFVPEGEFTMGSEDGEVNEKPVHTVFLDSFWIDQTEVTNQMFATFLNSRAAGLDVVLDWFSVDDNDVRIHLVDGSWQVDPEFENHPGIEMKWLGASAYCEWRGDGTRLPTEAEWEKAARGTTNNLYPWGNQIDCNLANYGTCTGGTVEVGSYPSNASPYGALDMTGNIMEWTADWYSEGYYQSSPSSNPLGPDSGQYRVLKGGSFDEHTEYQVRPTYRFIEAPDESKDDAGFRCVMPE